VKEKRQWRISAYGGGEIISLAKRNNGVSAEISAWRNQREKLAALKRQA
jgi:hypothetical protein